jgi:hypothetical protein
MLVPNNPPIITTIIFPKKISFIARTLWSVLP